MITCIDSVTVENAKEKRNEMDNFSKDYLKVAANVTTTVIEVAKNTGVNETEFKSLLTKFLEKPKTIIALYNIYFCFGACINKIVPRLNYNRRGVFYENKTENYNCFNLFYERYVFIALSFNPNSNYRYRIIY